MTRSLEMHIQRTRLLSKCYNKAKQSKKKKSEGGKGNVYSVDLTMSEKEQGKHWAE